MAHQTQLSDWQPDPSGSSATPYGYGHQPPATPSYGYGQSTAAPPYGYWPPPQQPRMDNGVKIALIVGGVLLVCTLLLTVAPMLFMHNLTSNLGDISGHKSEEILQNDLDVQVGVFTPDGRKYTKSGRLPVTFKNKSGERASFDVHIEAVDSQGRRVADDTAYVSDLGPGQSVTEDMFTLVRDDEYDAVVSATFKVIGVSKF